MGKAPEQTAESLPKQDGATVLPHKTKNINAGEAALTNVIRGLIDHGLH
jgi:hypothetical protein